LAATLSAPTFAPLRLCVRNSLPQIALLCALILAANHSREASADELALREQQAFNAAVESVADSVVQIHTVGGLDRLDGESLAQGPTTGLIITADGYIVSSAFNFAQQPASVLVRLPGGKQLAARLVGRDTNRMLVLLKVDADEKLPTPDVAPVGQARVGDWAIAVGRTYDAKRPNVSVGVVSALNRMFGRAIQTDANASAANYGGPLVDVRGRVLGVLVPMAPQAPGAAETSEIAGAEFYDSGIAFAVPLSDIRANLDRWISAGDLKRGLLGVGMADGNPHTTPPKVSAVWPRSPAAEAGWKADDVIIAIDGVAVETQTQLRFQTMPHYAGDKLAVTLRRGEGGDAEEINTQVTLADKLEPFRHAFLGVLPARLQPPADDKAEEGDDGDESSDESADVGVVIRSIWPDSPAAKAGLRTGDRITRLGDKEIDSLEAALAELNSHAPDDELAIVAKRGDEALELSTKLTQLPTEVLSSSDLPTKAAEGDDAPLQEDLKLETLKLSDLPQEAYFFRPATAKNSGGVLMWLGAGDEKARKELTAAWRDVCDRHGVTLLMPTPSDAKGWSSDDLEFLARLLPAAASRLSADPRRIVVGGEGKGGQLAYAFAFAARKVVRGVAVADSPLPRTLKLPQTAPGQRLAVLSVETQNESLTLLIHRDLQKLAEAGFPATQVERPTRTDEGLLDATTRATIGRWIGGLDRF
jgi:serine protease Do